MESPKSSETVHCRTQAFSIIKKKMSLIRNHKERKEKEILPVQSAEKAYERTKMVTIQIKG